MKSLLLFTALTLLLSCKKDVEPQNSIDSVITIDTREILAFDSRSLTFNCNTKRIYPCFSYSITTNNVITASSFSITFTGIQIPGICFASLASASAIIDLKSLPNGQYPIEFNVMSQSNEGMLRISDDAIQLIFGQQTGIEIVRPITKRVPSKTYWGTISYASASSANLVDEFLQKFVDKGVVFNKQKSGDYFYYLIDQNGDIVDNPHQYTSNIKSFVFQFDGDESIIKDVVTADGRNYQPDLTIYLETYKGEEVSNYAK